MRPSGVLVGALWVGGGLVDRGVVRRCHAGLWRPEILSPFHLECRFETKVLISSLMIFLQGHLSGWFLGGCPGDGGMATSDCDQQRSRVGLGEDREPGCSPDPGYSLAGLPCWRACCGLPADGSSVLLFGSGSLSRPYVAL